MIWNPSTGEYRKLPPARIVGKPDYIEDGFGYDQRIDDFKGGSNSWGPTKKIPYNLACQELAGRLQEVPDMGRLPVNGAIHWIAFRKSGQVVSKVILSFNFEKQEFAEIQLPNPLDERFHTNLCVLEGSLCLLHMSKLRVDLRELSNYGEENSWTMLFTIDVEKVFGYVGYLIPLRCFENGKSLLAFDRDGAFNMGLYDSERQTFKALMVFGGMISYSVCTTIYVESLHSPRKDTTNRLRSAEAKEADYDHKYSEKNATILQHFSFVKLAKMAIWPEL
ncbi:uncharacterized protein LOC113339666 [Papaver somniferum]|uniref:uncharacterized protein LOC113339666 n=1 Tax=Papaver somniferum TaxID=3469 RepID=UPI000E6FE435|nr:uncharacterized protein LOC113339666 [Papaver somniferum]